MTTIRMPDILGQAPRPWCYKCQKPVESCDVVMFDNVAAYKFRAYCHGEIDLCVIDLELFIAFGKMKRMEAFGPRTETITP